MRALIPVLNQLTGLSIQQSERSSPIPPPLFDSRRFTQSCQSRDRPRLVGRRSYPSEVRGKYVVWNTGRNIPQISESERGWNMFHRRLYPFNRQGSAKSHRIVPSWCTFASVDNGTSPLFINIGKSVLDDFPIGKARAPARRICQIGASVFQRPQ